MDVNGHQRHLSQLVRKDKKGYGCKWTPETPQSVSKKGYGCKWTPATSVG